MDKEKYILELSEMFDVDINGLNHAQSELNDLENKLFLIFKAKVRKDFYEELLPEIYRLKEKFNQELRKKIENIRTSKLKRNGGRK